jgi:hypothetical protein
VLLGEIVDGYRIVSCVGTGAMGDVYLAERADKKVAIKLLLPHASRERDHVRRFFNEARAVNKIKHAGTVKIFDTGFHKDRAYLIMELLEGETLGARMRRVGPLPVLELAANEPSTDAVSSRAGVRRRRCRCIRPPWPQRSSRRRSRPHRAADDRSSPRSGRTIAQVIRDERRAQLDARGDEPRLGTFSDALELGLLQGGGRRITTLEGEQHAIRSRRPATLECLAIERRERRLQQRRAFCTTGERQLPQRDDGAPARDGALNRHAQRVAPRCVRIVAQCLDRGVADVFGVVVPV